MRVIKPNWVVHPDDKGIPQTIYSAHVHPDGSRLATGSIQNLVKIWSTAPILDPDIEAADEEKHPRLLCTMEGHDGAVLCVRWTFSGAFLATGSDDSIIMIWLRCPGQSKSFGSKTANIEDWKCFKRLAGHTSDVQGLAWSEDDQYLASVGLDNLVLIWDCLDSSFVLLKRLDLHQGHVNGVVWDPVGQYLATQSDDRTVKIWRTTDWKLEADIKEPFINSPHSFFRRLSWSPDGSHIVTPNAMNGPVFVSAVIDRQKWTSEISLVGHENVVEVAAYNPLLFTTDPSPHATKPANPAAVIALGARNSISIWHTYSTSPIVVLHDVFDRDILDLSWAADGITLYACSSEGRVAAFVIDELTLLAKVAPPEVKAKRQASYNFQKADRRSSSTPFAPRYQSPMPAIGPYRPARPSLSPADSVANPKPSDALTTQQEMTIMPNGKRRIKPAFLGTNESAMYFNPLPNGHASTSQNPTDDSPHNYCNAHLPQPTQFPQQDTSNTTIPTRHAIPEHVTQGIASSSSLSRQLSDILHWDEVGRWGEPIALPHRLFNKVQYNQTEYQISCENTQGDMDVESSQVILSSVIANQESELWKKRFTARSITAASLSTSHLAIGLSDKSLLVYSLAGRRVMPVALMDSPCFKLQFRDTMLMSISLKGTVMVWDVAKLKAVCGPSKLKHLSDSKAAISYTALTPQGAVIVKVGKGSLYGFERDLESWTVLSGPTADEQQEKERLDLRELAFPVGSPFLIDSAAVLAANKAELMTCFLEHIASLRDHRRFQAVDELCHELWTGSGWISDRISDSEASATPHTLKLSKLERMDLLHQVIQVLDQHQDFGGMCQEYAVLLRHGHN
ncbi:hypothetical protein PCASD_13872 [Puccinia coronata f. sp. avenae]|uniref:Protein HIR n=1 Tax=Puccinia coronata f. sp. avenae TaxID=200324 RepID=A0A2N5U822_9BASI|nr:hypothetical protein PCASD_13872 [Puccinia coronata f. sp. avenae]